MKKINYINYFRRCTCLFLASILLLSAASCKKWTEVPGPVNSLNAGNVYTTDASAIGVLTGIYAKMSRNSTYEFDFQLNALSDVSMSILPGLSADELRLYTGPEFLTNYYLNALVTITDGNSFWEQIYGVVFVCNSAIEGLDKSNGLTPGVKKQLQGEAKFMRAFCYFYLVNLYGDVPLALTTDYKVNALLARTSKAKVYAQIITDLKDAEILLNSSYLDASLMKAGNQRVRPNKWVAKALLARAYLYSGANALAEASASELISNSAMFSLLPLNEVFLPNSDEAIWQLQPVGNSIYANTAQARYFILPSDGPNDYQHYYYLNPRLADAFEIGDERKAQWTGNVTVGTDTYYYAYKYKAGDNVIDETHEYMMVMRLAEQYLIRAEARVLQGNVSGAVADLNILRTRARGTEAGDLPNLSAGLSAQQALNAVAKERRLELFTEWGHRWLDLKRTGEVNAVMSVEAPLKGGTWKSDAQLYPVPIGEIFKDPNLIQNPGYQ